MGIAKKFSSKMDEEILEKLRDFSRQENRDISSILTEATTDFLNKKRIKPAFKEISDEAFDEYDNALKELAK